MLWPRPGRKVASPRRALLRARPSRGFTIIEVMVATFVVMMAALAMAVVMTEAVAAVSVSRQSQQASNLASSVVAEGEALPWSTIGNGLNSGSDSYYATDANIASGCFEGKPLVVGGAAVLSCPESGAGSGTWAWVDAPGPACQTSLVGTATSANAPLVPHESCVALNGTSYEIASYPTLYAGTSPTSVGAEIQLTVVVAWKAGAAGSVTRQTDSVVLSSCSGQARCS